MHRCLPFSYLILHHWLILSSYSPLNGQLSFFDLTTNTAFNKLSIIDSACGSFSSNVYYVNIENEFYGQFYGSATAVAALSVLAFMRSCVHAFMRSCALDEFGRLYNTYCNACGQGSGFLKRQKLPHTTTPSTEILMKCQCYETPGAIKRILSMTKPIYLGLATLLF